MSASVWRSLRNCAGILVIIGGLMALVVWLIPAPDVAAEPNLRGTATMIIVDGVRCIVYDTAQGPAISCGWP